MKRLSKILCVIVALSVLCLSLCSCKQQQIDLSSLYNQTDQELALNSDGDNQTDQNGGVASNNKKPADNNQNQNNHNHTQNDQNTNSDTPQNNGGATQNKAADFSKLDELINSIPEEYTKYVSKKTVNTVSALIGSANNLNRKKATQSQVDGIYNDLLDAVNNPDYSVSDISTVYIEYSKAPVYRGDYVGAKVSVVDHKSGLNSIVIDNSAQIRIRGNTTAGFAKSPYNIKFSTKKNLFNMGDDRGWYLLANAFDKTLMRNAVALEFAKRAGVNYCAEYRFVDVYVNGKYRGNYMITEKVEANKDRIDIDIENGDFLIEITEKDGGDITYVTTSTLKARFEVNEPEKPTAAQKAKLQDILDKADAAINSGNISEMKKYIDIESFVNFYIANEYLKMLDFHYSSPRFYIKDSKVYAGPVWDFDLSMGNANANFAPYADYMSGNGLGASYKGLWCQRSFPWYVTLMKNSEFKKLVKARYNELQPQIVNTYEKNELGNSLVDTFYSEYKASFNRNFTTAGWTFTTSSAFENVPKPTLIANIDDLKNWLKNRNKWLTEEFNSY